MHTPVALLDIDVPSAIELYFCNLRASTTTWYVIFALRPEMSRWSSVNQNNTVISVNESNTVISVNQSNTVIYVNQSNTVTFISQSNTVTNVNQSITVTYVNQSNTVAYVNQNLNDMSIKTLQ